MSQEPQKPRYRIIQWATGTVGQTAIRHFATNPAFELVGVYVTNPDKVGKDAGAISGIADLGITATDDAEALLAIEADCVHFAPLVQDVNMVCRILRSGKNVVSPLGPYFRTTYVGADCDAIEEACRAGGTSFHGCGIHPGFAGDILPLILSRIMNRIDHIHVYEIVDHLANPSGYIEFMGFGRDCADLLAKPSRSDESPRIFAQSMAMVLETLGMMIEDLTTKFEVAAALRDIAYPGGVIRAGTAAGQHYEWTAWSGGRPVMTYHCFWTMGEENIAPRWDVGPSGYRIVFEGDPPLEMRLGGPRSQNGDILYPGLAWTAMAGVNAIPTVCDAEPGMVTHLGLGLFGPRGLLRS